jgi:hypothetical protein
MEFRLSYLQAMLFNQLNREGKLQAYLDEKAAEASRLFHELTANAPKEQGGYPKEPEASEAIEQVMAVMLDFPKHEQTTRQMDERSALQNLPQT